MKNFWYWFLVIVLIICVVVLWRKNEEQSVTIKTILDTAKAHASPVNISTINAEKVVVGSHNNIQSL